MTQDKRNRNSVALTSEGTDSIRHELRKKGWQRKAWARRGYVSCSTIGRLLAGKFIDMGSFKSLTNALGIEIPEIHIVSKANDIESTLLMKLTPSDTHIDINNTAQFSHFGFIMTAIFDEDKRMDMELAIRHLQSLLVDQNNSHIFFKESDGAVVVTGKFSKENRSHIDLAISRIDNLSNCKVTEMPC